jgi:hypothetical protein
VRSPHLHRISAVVLGLFAAGHTAGGMFGPHRFGAEAEAVFSSMKAVEFRASGSICSWYGFWMGFGLIDTVFLLFGAAVAWQLGGMARVERRRVALLCWAFFASLVALAVLSWKYFFLPPGVMATLVAALVGIECVRDARGSGARAVATG